MSRDRLGLSRIGIRFIEQRLALEIAPFDDVAIDQREPPESRAGELIDDAAAECAVQPTTTACAAAMARLPDSPIPGRMDWRE